MPPFSEKDLEVKLDESGKTLMSRPLISASELLTFLDQTEKLLSQVDQSPAKSMQTALSMIMKALVMEDLMKHLDLDVKVGVASCINQITRITAPDAPYGDDKMKDIFQLIVSSFKNLSDTSSRSHEKRAFILETMAKVRSCVIMLDLECEQMIIEMFQHFLDSIRDYHSEVIFASMETIMILTLEESEHIPVDLINPLLATLKRNNEAVQSAAKRLAERVIQNCAVKLGPYLAQAVSTSDTSLGDYSAVVASLCQKNNCTGGYTNESSSKDQLVAKDGTAESIPENKHQIANRPLKLTLSNGDANYLMTTRSAWKEKLGDASNKMEDAFSSRNEIRGKSGRLKPRSEKSVHKSCAKDNLGKDMVTSPRSPLKPRKDESNKKEIQVMSTKKKQTPGIYKASDATQYGENLVGSKVKVLWPADRRFYEGVIASFDCVKKKHKVIYADGDEEVLNLINEQWKFVRDDPVSDEVAKESRPEDKYLIDSRIQPLRTETSKNEDVNVASSNLSGSLPEKNPNKKSSWMKRRGILVREDTVPVRTAPKKGSGREIILESKKQRRSGKKQPDKTVNEDVALTEEGTFKNDNGSTNDSGTRSARTEKLRDTSNKIEDASSSRNENRGKSGRLKPISEKNVGKSTSKEDLGKDMVTSPRSPLKPRKDESNKKEIPVMRTKRKRTPGPHIASGALQYDENLIGSKVKVLWPVDMIFYEGVIASFDHVTKKHKVIYADGDEEVLNLIKERWEFVRDDPVSYEVAKDGTGESRPKDKHLIDSSIQPLRTETSKIEDVAVASPNQSGSLHENNSYKKSIQMKREENPGREETVPVRTASKKASKREIFLESNKQRRSGKKQPDKTVNEDVALTEEGTSKNHNGSTSDSETTRSAWTEKLADAINKMVDVSSSRHEDRGKSGRLKPRSERNVQKSSAKDDLGKDMVSSPRSPSIPRKDESNMKEIPVTSSKRKRIPATDKASDATEYGENLVNAKVKVWWPVDRMFYEGVIASFDHVKKKHKVIYPDGDEEVLNLIKERWKFVRDGPVSILGEGLVVDFSSLGTSIDTQQKKKGTCSESFGKCVKLDRLPKSISKGTASKSVGKSKDEMAEPKWKKSEGDITKPEGRSKELGGKSHGDSVKSSDRTKNIKNSNISSHSEQHNRRTAKSTRKTRCVKTLGTVGIGFMKSDKMKKKSISELAKEKSEDVAKSGGSETKRQRR